MDGVVRTQQPRVARHCVVVFDQLLGVHAMLWEQTQLNCVRIHAHVPTATEDWASITGRVITSQVIWCSISEL